MQPEPDLILAHARADVIVGLCLLLQQQLSMPGTTMSSVVTMSNPPIVEAFNARTLQSQWWHVGAGADRLCTSDTAHLLFSLAAGVLVSAAAGMSSLLRNTTLDDRVVEMLHSENEAAAAAAVLGANVQNAMQILQTRPRTVASHQVVVLQ